MRSCSMYWQEPHLGLWFEFSSPISLILIITALLSTSLWLYILWARHSGLSLLPFKSVLPSTLTDNSSSRSSSDGSIGCGSTCIPNVWPPTRVVLLDWMSSLLAIVLPALSTVSLLSLVIALLSHRFTQHGFLTVSSIT